MKATPTMFNRDALSNVLSQPLQRIRSYRSGEHANGNTNTSSTALKPPMKNN